MDVLLDNLPAPLRPYLTTSTLRTVLRTVLPYIRLATPYLSPLIAALTPLLHVLKLVALTLTSLFLKALLALPPAATPWVVLAGLLLGLYVALKVTALVRRAMLLVAGLVVRLGVLGALLGVAWYAWQQGAEKSLADVGYVAGVLRGWWEEGRAEGRGKAAGWERWEREAEREGLAGRRW